MNPHRPCSNELVIRERRGLLSSSERVALDAHLASCASCRLDLDFGRLFDPPDAPELDDGARIQRLARAGETWSRNGRAPRRWRPPRTTVRRRVFLAVAACLVLCCGIAGATLGGGSLARVAAFLSSRPAPAVESSPPSRPVGRTRAAASSPAPEPPAQVQTATLEEAIDDRREVSPPPIKSVRAAPSAKVHHASAPADAPEDAPTMLRAANDARRSGDGPEAMALYAKLERRFPSSPEAELSSVPFGEMLLADHRPGAALAQFERPAGALGGTLRPEVLYGRARALAALGDQGGERRAWRDLLDEFPKCPYVETARRRLESEPSSAASSSP